MANDNQTAFNQAVAAELMMLQEYFATRTVDDPAVRDRVNLELAASIEVYTSKWYASGD